MSAVEISRPTLVDPTTLTVGENVRRTVRLGTDFKRDVAERGVRQPIEVRNDALGQLLVVTGQRRTLAALEAGLAEVPVVLVDDIADDADRIVEQLGENHHRAGLTRADDVAAVHQLALFGLSPAKIAKRTHRTKDEITAALALADVDEETRGRLDGHEGLDLVTTAKIADVAGGDAAVLEELTAVATERPDQVDHAIERARQDRARRQAVSEREAELRAQGVTVLDETPQTIGGGATAERLGNLTDKPNANGYAPEIDATEHQLTCPGHAVRVTAFSSWASDGDGFKVEDLTYCLDWRANGHHNRYARNTAGAKSGAEPEDAKAERRRVVENGKAADAAQAVRRAFISERYTNRAVKPADVEVQHAALMIASGRPDEYGVDVALRELLGDAGENITKAGTIRRSPDAGKRYLLALAMAIGEHSLSVTRGKESWWARAAADGYLGTPSLGAAHLRFLADAGYGLSDLEQAWLDAYEAREA